MAGFSCAVVAVELLDKYEPPPYETPTLLLTREPVDRQSTIAVKRSVAVLPAAIEKLPQVTELVTVMVALPPPPGRGMVEMVLLTVQLVAGVTVSHCTPNKTPGWRLSAVRSTVMGPPVWLWMVMV